MIQASNNFQQLQEQPKINPLIKKLILWWPN